MPQHKKPTPEELDEKVKEAANIPEEDLNKPSEDESQEDPNPEAEPSEPAPSEPVPSEPAPSEPAPEPESQADPSKELYKKKFKESSKENQKIYAKNRVINKALAEAEDVPEPTEEELQVEFADWDMMSDIEHHLARETVISRRWREVISKAKEQASKIEKWNDAVETFAEDPKTLLDNPDLEGKQEDFKEFAKQEANNSISFNILVSAFLHEQSKKKPANKGRMLERGSGGPNDKPTLKSDKISLDEARQLRETNYTKYKEYLMAGKIDTTI